MVTEQEEILWGYLLDPCFELSNTAGKPLTNGWIEVYIHGTRNKYYCASDFDGTLHPFKIPLDSLGSNIVLADPNRSYDVYVYDRFGSLEMSRYNVSPGHASGAAVIGGGDAEHWLGRDGSVTDVTNNVPKTLELPQIGVDYDGSFIDHINTQNTAMYLKPGIYLVNAVVEFKQDDDDLTNTIGQVQINTGLDNVEDQSFDRNETGPDAGDGSHYMKVMFIRHVTGEDDGSDVLHINIQSPNDLSMARIWSLQIAKLGGGSASQVQPIEYDAGQYIDIDGDVINVTGLQPAGDYVERSEMSGYQPAGNYVNQSTYNSDMYDVHQTLQAHGREIDEVSGTLDQKADRSDIPSLDGYATEEYVQSQVSGKADKSEIPSLQGYATETWVQNQHYLTSVPDNYATDAEVQAAVSGKADKSEIPSLNGYATETYVQSEVSGKQDELEFTYDEDDKITSIDGHEIAGTGGGSGGTEYSAGQYVSIQNDIISVTGLQPSGEYLTAEDLNGYATTEDLEAAVSGKADKSEIPSVAGLASEQYVDEHIEEATSGKADVSAIPSLNGYATESWVNEQGFLKEVPQEFITDDEMNAAISGKMDASEASAFYPMASNPSGYLTEHQSLDGYATEQYVQDQTSGFVDSGYVSEYVDGAVSGKQDTLEFGYTSGGSVSAINNSGIYDAPLNEFVNQNSGAWGGEALPVSGGHGVRMRMDNGILIAEADETVLWSGNASKNDVMQLSEPFSGFHYLELYGSIVQDNGTHNMLPACKVCIDDVVLPASFNIAGWSWWGNISNYKIGMNIGTYADSYSAIQHAGGVFEGYWDNLWQAAENNNLKINRIVGINRKSGGN